MDLLGANFQVDGEMNGLPLLLLASTVGMDFGWQPAKDNPNMLEYIVQLSPEEIQLLNSGQEELFSGIPQELKGRIDRVVIRMGREKLPQVPSLEKLRTMASVAGNPSILNAGGSATGTSLSVPSMGVGSALSPVGGGLSTIDPPRTLEPPRNLSTFPGSNSPAPTPPLNYPGNYDLLGSGLYEDMLRQGTMPPGTSTSGTLADSGSGIPAMNVSQLGASGGGSPPSGLSGGSTLPTDPRITYAPPSNLGSPHSPTTPPNNNAILPRDNNGTFLGGGSAASGGGSVLPSGGQTLPAGGWTPANPQLANTQPTNNQGIGGNLGPRGTATGSPVGFNSNSVSGNTLGGNPQMLNPNNGSFVNNTASGNPQFSGMGNNSAANPNRGGVAGGGATGGGALNSNFGTNPTLIASSNTSNTPLGASSSVADDEASPSAAVTDEANAPAAMSNSNWEKVLQILFILSVVMNFYLGVHLHKLVLRYRTLLASVRASTTGA